MAFLADANGTEQRFFGAPLAQQFELDGVEEPTANRYNGGVIHPRQVIFSDPTEGWQRRSTVTPTKQELLEVVRFARGQTPRKYLCQELHDSWLRCILGKGFR
ncbi:MAG: hypothetical protein ACUVWA_12420 [Candidatus Oleimicrobiaceae bacterium]